MTDDTIDLCELPRTDCPCCRRSWRECDCGERETDDAVLDRETA